jgi:hypothetical protein
MTDDSLMRRIRVANPVRTETIIDLKLMHSITDRPGDARFGGTSTHPGAWRIRSPRRLATVLTAVAIVAGASTVAVADSGTYGQVLGLFSNPSPDTPVETTPAYAALWTQSVIPSSIRDAAAVTIPGVGIAQFWYAQTTQGGWCSALKLPDGNWAGTTTDDPSDGGGSQPGCQPTRVQINAAGTAPVYEIDGFDYDAGNIALEANLRAFSGDGYWHVYYGMVSTDGDPIRVVEENSGASVPIEPGGLFAIAVWDPNLPSEGPPNGVPFTPHFVAVNAAGTTVADTGVPGQPGVVGVQASPAN